MMYRLIKEITMKKLFIASMVAGLLSSAAFAQENNLKIAFADNLSSLDPQLNNFAGDRSAGLFFFDMLVANYHNKLLPALAVEWKNIDPHTWEFSLREGVEWSDGQPFVAEDVVYSIDRIRQVPGSVAPFTGYVRTIEEVTIKDPNTLIIKTTIPNPDLPLNLASVPIVSKHST